MTVTAYLALGSNLFDRRDFLDRALATLQEQPGVVVTQVSSYVETAPVGGPPGQGDYLNAAAEIQTELAPEELLRVLLDVEKGLGRVRTERDGPRTIDLDLLLYGDRVINEAGLIVPHPRMHERIFVLRPLAEIASQVRHPLLCRSVSELLAQQLHEKEAQLARDRAQLLEERRQLNEDSEILKEDIRKMEQTMRHSLTMLRRGVPGQLIRAELAGLRALVTGSSSGIGKAIALELTEAGADVIVHGRHQATAADVWQQLQMRNPLAHFLLADLRDQEQCRKLVEQAWDHWDGLDIWINNAGADTLTGEAAHWSFERKLQELLAVDVTATMLLSRDIGQRMKAHGSGVILNIGWDQAETGMEGDSGELFAAAKGAVMAFSKSLALSLAPQVRVNCLAPGWIKTAWGAQASEGWQERVTRETPLGRWGTPEDVAAAARWLVSPAAAFLTGQVIRVNGGAVT